NTESTKGESLLGK
uniref:Conopeptide Vi003 n=1 Tax=Conus virgo TaxID=89427 RepID=CU03_CONVR|nr:RecName: Full=Conopeptide Vi003 [Conus virgo]